MASDGEGLYGRGSLWVGLPDGVVVVASSGRLGTKLGWWRGESGALSIEVHRLDAASPPTRGVVPSGYGPSGFQASGVSVQDEGCYEVVGRLEDVGVSEEIRFVLRFVRGTRDVHEALERFMQARIDRDEQLTMAMLTGALRSSLAGGLVQGPLIQVSNPCWYRFEVLSVEEPTPMEARARVRVYQHFWGGEIVAGPPWSWEQELGLVALPFPGWLVDALGNAEGRRGEPHEPRGRNGSACATERP